jgi:hypothetical protein
MLDKRERKRLRHNIVPNAAFKTKHGPINLNLSTSGTTDLLGKAYVQVVTQHGRVNVNLVSVREPMAVFRRVTHLSLVCVTGE